MKIRFFSVKLILGCLLSMPLAAAVCPAGADNALPITPEMRARSLIGAGDPARLFAVFARARRGEPIVIAAIGGSITAGGKQTKDPNNRYVAQIARWFETNFPHAKVTYINAGIGSTNSAYGALRVKRDVVDKQPDLVVVEYAVNDWHPAAKFGDCYEGILRQILASARQPAVLELFFMHKDGNSAQSEQERLGRHYGLPMISFRDAFYPEYKGGRLRWEDYYADVVHPNDIGHSIASELVRGLLNRALASFPAADSALPAIKPLSAPLLTDDYEHCWLFRPGDLKPVSSVGWTTSGPGALECGPAGGTLEFKAPGRMLLLGSTIPVSATGKVKMAVDGAQPVVISRDGPNRPIFSNLSPEMHGVIVTVEPYSPSEQDKDAKIQIWWGGGAGVKNTVTASVPHPSTLAGQEPAL